MTTALERAATDATTTMSTVAVQAIDPNRVDAPHAAYQRMQERSAIARALLKNAEGIRGLGTKVLPMLEAESDEGYEARKKIAALDPTYEQTLGVLIGLLLHQGPILSTDVQEKFRAFCTNVDGAGATLHLYCIEYLFWSLVDGVDGTFVDYTRRDDPTLDRSRASAAADDPAAELSEDDEVALGLRPYWVLVKQDEVVKPLYAKVGGVKTLVGLVRKQVGEEYVAPYGLKQVTRLYAYLRVRGASGVQIQCQRFIVEEGAAEPKKDGAPVTLKNQVEISWDALRTGHKLGEFETMPTLQSLIDLIIEHHRIWTNMLSLSELAMVPNQVRIGAEQDSEGNYPPIVRGPRKVLEAPHVEGVAKPIYWDSPDVSVLEPAEKQLDRNEKKMAKAKAKLLEPDKNGVEAAHAKVLGQRGENATISTFGRRLEASLNRLKAFTCAFLGVPNTGTITISLAFEEPLMEPDVMLAYVKLVEAGYPKLLALQALQEGGRIPRDADLQALEDEWEGELVKRAREREREAEIARQSRTPTEPVDG